MAFLIRMGHFAQPFQLMQALSQDRVQRLGRNIREYSGETIDIDRVQHDCIAAAQAHGWTIEEIHPAPRRILGLTRQAPRKTHHAPRLYISTGIHGDEPAGLPGCCCRRMRGHQVWRSGCAPA
jgi:hypothetical protein